MRNVLLNVFLSRDGQLALIRLVFLLSPALLFSRCRSIVRFRGTRRGVSSILSSIRSRRIDIHPLCDTAPTTSTLFADAEINVFVTPLMLHSILDALTNNRVLRVIKRRRSLPSRRGPAAFRVSGKFFSRRGRRFLPFVPT